MLHYFIIHRLYQVVASAVLSMSNEVTAARMRLEDLVRRRDDIERELGEEEIQETVINNNQMRNRTGVMRQSSLPAKLHQKQPNEDNQRFNFDLAETFFSQDNHLDNQDEMVQDTQGWLFSPRSASPVSEYQEQMIEPPDPAAIASHKKQYPKIVINVGGVKHEVMWKMLEKRPLTRLGLLAKARTHEDVLKLVDAYSLTDNEIYFDRDPHTFNSILNFYRTDHLHVIDELCVLDFAEDLEFWMIKEINLEICCVDKFNTRRDHILAEVEKAKHLQQTTEEVVEDFGDGYFVQYQRALWDLFEKPQSSFCAKMISLLSIGLVLVSTIGMCLNTFPSMQAKDINGEPVDNPKLALMEAVCISYFTIEYLLRLAGSPSKINFMKGTMNVIDCLAIAPYYLTLFFFPHPEMGPVDDSLPTMAPGMEMEEEQEESSFGNVGRIMQVFRIARIMRIFKLARRSVGLQSIAHTVRTSWKDLGLLFMLVGMGMLVFGSLEYFIENEEPETGFTSIPQGMWWAVQTLTSLGYGDFWPQTLLGKIVGSMCAVCGVLVMALPIPIVVDNFADYYSEQKKIEAQELKKEAQAKQAEIDIEAELVARRGLVSTLISSQSDKQNGAVNKKF